MTTVLQTCPASVAASDTGVLQGQGPGGVAYAGPYWLVGKAWGSWDRSGGLVWGLGHMSSLQGLCDCFLGPYL